MLKWIESFLYDRKQRVNIDGYFSRWKAVNAGVPQGSTLGLFVFLLFINDIENEVLNNIKMFADDTSLYCVVEDQTSAAESRRILRVYINGPVIGELRLMHSPCYFLGQNG